MFRNFSSSLLMLAFLLVGCSKYDAVRKSLDFLKTDSFPCDVVQVKDADLFYCQLSNRDTEKIELIGVEIPKLVEEKATAFAKSLLKRGTPVKLEFDEEARDSDGRILAYVHLPGGKILNNLLIQEGYAQVVVNSPNFKYKDLYLDLQKEAKEQGKGLWGKQ